MTPKPEKLKKSTSNRIKMSLSLQKEMESLNWRGFRFLTPPYKYSISPLLYLITEITYLHESTVSNLKKIDKIKDTLFLLIEEGFDVNQQESNALFSLMYADETGVEILLGKGANPDVQDMDGMTCLMRAAKDPVNKKVLQLLLAGGANLEIKDKVGQTVWDYAGGKGLDILNEHKAKKDQEYLDKTLPQNLEIAKPVSPRI